MPKIIQTTSENADFRELIRKLDHELRSNYEFDQSVCEQYSQVDAIAHAMVAYVDGQAVGCGCFRVLNPETVEVKRMFVLREFRGLGISKQVLAALESWAAGLNFKTAVLETGALQTEAIRLYKTYGYQSIPNYGPYVDLPHSSCFEKSL
ncbi:MAG: GNAT family N-acetyltransferase [Mangrovibacterium sp.]